MRYYSYNFQKASLILFMSAWPSVQAEEKTSIRIYEDLKLKLQTELEAGKLTGLQKQQAYDIVGSLGLCQPVVQSVLEHSSNPQELHSTDAGQSQLSAEIQAPQPSLPEEPILQKFDTLKNLLIQQLSENKIAPEHHESAYTLIGSINLCRPILKGAEMLSVKLEIETKDHLEPEVKDQTETIPSTNLEVPAPHEEVLNTHSQ